LDTKKFFPYHFNVDDNYDITLDGLPDIDQYGPGSMMPAERAELQEWYATNKDKIKFNLNDQIAEYCSHGTCFYCFKLFGILDVKILVTGFVHMLKLFERVTTLDISDSITIASACMRFFRLQLRPNHLAMTPHMVGNFYNFCMNY
jgi:hypothetical protein